MRARDFLKELKIDNVKGWGAVPFNQDVDYFGLRVLMKPSIFLQLADAIYSGHEKGVDKIVQHLQSGGSVGAPFLQIEYSSHWEDGDFSAPAHVYGHEGRHRMIATQKLEGDAPVEVHLLFSGGVRSRDLTPEIIKALNTRIVPQGANRRHVVLKGPFFEVVR